MSVPHFQKQSFVAVLQYLSKLLLKRSFRYFICFNPFLAHDLVGVLKLITEKVYQVLWNFLKIDNKDINKEHDKDMILVHQKNTW